MKKHTSNQIKKRLPFSKRLKAQGAHRTFYFNLAYGATGTRWHVTVVDKENKAQMFNMIESRSTWKLENPATCPRWIVEMESELANSISEFSLKQYVL